MTGLEFRSLRRLAGLTQEQTARVLEVTHRTVMRWEHGETRISSLNSEGIRARLLKQLFSAQERTDSES